MSNSRVILLTEVEEIEGAERSVIALSRYLHKHGLPHHFVTYVDRAKLAARAGYPVEVVELRPELDIRHKVLALRTYFAKNAGEPAPLVSGYQAALHATLAGARGFHCLMHDTPSLFEAASELSLYQRGYRWTSNRVVAKGLRSGGHTIVTSKFLQMDCQRLFRVQADIARMGGLSPVQDVQGKSVDRTLRLLSVSRIEDNKRLDWILHALGSLERGPEALSQKIDWQLDVIGRGAQLRTLDALAKESGIAERVRFHGYVSDAELHNFYEAAHLFLMPAVQGYGIPAIEALERGLHVLIHRESGVSDLLLDTPWATVFTGNEESMLPALRKAVDTVLRGGHLAAGKPEMPSEDQWAERVTALCGWM